MNYTVVWLYAAQDMLETVWLAAADRNAVTAASDRIDRQLAADPLDAGESRDGTDRLVIDRPLQVLCRVFAAERRVEVFSVAAFGR